MNSPLPSLLSALGKLQVKRDPWLVLLAIVLAVGCYLAVTKQAMTPKEALFFLGGVYALPSFFGRKPDESKSPEDDLRGDDDDDDDPPPPSGARAKSPAPPPSVRIVPPAARLALAMAVAALTLSCGLLGTKTPDERSIARGAVLATAEAVKAADEACAKFGKSKHDADLLNACSAHYNSARIALISTASAVDLWDRAESRRSVACALVDALTEVDRIGAELGRRGGTVPPVVSDAKSLVGSLGGCDE